MQINLVFGANKANEAFKNPFQKGKQRFKGHNKEYFIPNKCSNFIIE